MHSCEDASDIDGACLHQHGELRVSCSEEPLEHGLYFDEPAAVDEIFLPSEASDGYTVTEASPQNRRRIGDLPKTAAALPPGNLAWRGCQRARRDVSRKNHPVEVLTTAVLSDADESQRPQERSAVGHEAPAERLRIVSASKVKLRSPKIGSA